MASELDQFIFSQHYDQVLRQLEMSEIEQAFKKHFGFELKDVMDKQNLQKVEVEGSSLVYLRYSGEDFYVMSKDMQVEVKHEGDSYEVIVSRKGKAL